MIRLIAIKVNPLIEVAKREIFEESGLKVKDSDSIDDVSEFSQDEAEGSELFNGYELVGRKEAAEIFRSERDKYGNFVSIATWVVLAHFLLEE